MSLLPTAATDRRFLLAVTLALLLATSVPYLGAWLATPAGMTPSGVYYQNSADWNVYYSYIAQAERGQLVMHNPFSTEDDRPAYVFPVFAIAGVFSRLTRLPPAISFQMLRLALLPLLVLLAAAVFRQYGFPEAWRWALLIFLFAGGFGQPGEWPDLVPFLGFLFSPHYVVSWILALWMLLLMPDARRGSGTAIRTLAIAETLLLLTHPFAGVAMLVVTLFTFGFRSRSWRPVSTFVALLVPIIVYQLVTAGRTGSQQYLAHNALLRAPLAQTLVSLSALLFLALASARQWQRCSSILLVAAGYSLIGLLIPGPYQLRLLFPLPLVLATFGGRTIHLVQQFLHRRLKSFRLAGAVTGMALFVTTGWAAVAMATKTVVTAPQYAMTSQLAEIVRWVGTHTPPDSRVLSSQDLGNLIAGQTGRTVYVGHGVQTPSAEQKDQFVISMLAGQVPAPAVKRLLREQRITNVVAVASSPGLQQPADLGLRPVFTNGDYAVYSVVNVYP